MTSTAKTGGLAARGATNGGAWTRSISVCRTGLEIQSVTPKARKVLYEAASCSNKKLTSCDLQQIVGAQTLTEALMRQARDIQAIRALSGFGRNERV